MKEFFKLELLLLEKEERLEMVWDFYQRCLLKQEHSSNFLKIINNTDAYYVYVICVQNTEIIQKMAAILHEHYFTNLKTLKTRDSKQINLIIENLEPNLTNQESCSALSYLLAVWFIKSFHESTVLIIPEHPSYLWAAKYEIIQNTYFIFINFLKKLGFLRNLSLDYFLKNDEIFFKELIWSLLYILVNSYIIEEIEWKQSCNESYKSTNYLGISDSLTFFKNQANIKIYNYPLSVKNIIDNQYLIEEHYLSIRNIIKKNNYSHTNSSFKNHNFLINRSNMKLYINWDFFKFVMGILLDFYKLKKTISAQEFQQLLLEKKKILWSSKHQKEFSHLFSLNYFFHIEELRNFLKDGFYFRYYFDFRGRFYADSPVGYTQNRFFRYIYNYGYYTLEEKEEFEKIIMIEDIAHSGLICQKTNLCQKYPQLNLNDSVVLYYIEVIFFQFGKIFKNKLIQENNGVASYKEFIDQGIEAYNDNSVNREKIESQIEYWSLVFVLEDLNNGRFVKAPIFYDATASVIQILILVLGSKKEENFKITNLIDANKWYDTYFFIIKNFLEKEQLPHIYVKYFSRSILKKTIMTYNYKASYITCWDEFKTTSGIKKSEARGDMAEVEDYFKKFYKFLNDIFNKGDFFEHSSAQITKYFNESFFKNENFCFLTDDNFTIYLKYFMFKLSKRSDKILPGKIKKRRTIQWYALSDEYDNKKTNRASQANFVHIIDGFIIRELSRDLDIPVMSIHDSVGVPIFKIKIFKKSLQKVMQKIYDNNTLNLNRSITNITIQSNFIFL